MPLWTGVYEHLFDTVFNSFRHTARRWIAPFLFIFHVKLKHLDKSAQHRNEFWENWNGFSQSEHRTAAQSRSLSPTLSKSYSFPVTTSPFFSQFKHSQFLTIIVWFPYVGTFHKLTLTVYCLSFCAWCVSLTHIFLRFNHVIGYL